MKSQIQFQTLKHTLFFIYIVCITLISLFKRT